MTRRIDCKDDGCGECQMCRYLDFLEWAGQVSGGVPSTIQRNAKLDARIAAKIAAQGSESPIFPAASAPTGQAQGNVAEAGVSQGTSL